jgi:hypothetical protein
LVNPLGHGSSEISIVDPSSLAMSQAEGFVFIFVGRYPALTCVDLLLYDARLSVIGI